MHTIFVNTIHQKCILSDTQEILTLIVINITQPQMLYLNLHYLNWESVKGNIPYNIPLNKEYYMVTQTLTP